MLEEALDQDQQPFDWRSHLAILRRRRWLILLPFFAGWLAVWMVSWWLPSIYRSGTLILVEQPTVPQQFVVPNIAGDLQERLQNITQQILSRTRLLHIIEGLNLYAKERQRRTPDETVERMRKDIEIELVRDKNNQLTAFNIYYSSRDPQVAQRVTSELSNLFISENLEARQAQSQSTTKFLESELEEARKSLSEQEEKVREFKDKHLGELPGQMQSNLQILSGLQTQLQTEEEALNHAKQQNVYLESLLGQYRNHPESPKSGSNASMGLPEIDQELQKLRAQLADLTAHYTDRHPDVRKLKEQNDSELATSLELQQQGEHFRVLDPPSLPVKPYSPKRLQLCAIGLVVGLLLGGATTAGAELLDDRIHDEKTLKKLIQIPVLSEIPNVSTDTETRAERRDGWLVWATTSLVLVSILAGSALSYFRG